MKKVLILTLIFLLLFNTAFAQYRITTEIVNFVGAISLGSGFLVKIDYYIPGFYYAHIKNSNGAEPIIQNPDSPYIDYYAYPYVIAPFSGSLSGKVKLKTFEWLYNINTIIILLDETLQNIEKIYIYKGKATLLSGNNLLLIEADKDKDLITTLDGLNFVPWGPGCFACYKPTLNVPVFIKKDLNDIVYDGSPNIYGKFYTPYERDIPNDFFILIAEGRDSNNNIVRKIIQRIDPGEGNYIKFTASTDLFIFLNYPVGSLNPDNYDNILRFSLFAPAEYNPYKFYLEIYDNNTGKSLYTSDIFQISNYTKERNEITLNLNNYFDLKQVLINLRNEGYSNLQINLYVKLIDNNNNETPFLSSASTIELLGGISREEYAYKDWYSDVISTFGLSGATPTPIFVKAGEFIDKLFSFSLLPTFDIENKGKELAEKFNIFLSYLKAFPLTSAFLLAILGFYTFRLAYKFIKLVALR